MAEYTITFARPARKELEALDASIVNRIFPKIETLAEEPRPPGCRKLTGEEDLFMAHSYRRLPCSLYDKRQAKTC